MRIFFIKYIKNYTLFVILLLLTTKLTAQVGVETSDPKTNLDVNGAISFREGPALVLSNGINNNINLGSAPYSFYKITGPTTTFNINGIVPLAGADGQIVVLQNTTTAIMIIVNNSSTSTAANRISLSGQSEFMLRGKYATITLQYSANQSRWVLLNNFNRVKTYYTQSTKLWDEFKNDVLVNIPELTATSGVIISLVNNSGLPDFEKFNLIVEYVEAQDGFIKFRVNNKNPDTEPGNGNNSFVIVQYALTYFIN